MLDKNDLKAIEKIIDSRISLVRKDIKKLATKRSLKMMENRLLKSINYAVLKSHQSFSIT